MRSTLLAQKAHHGREIVTDRPGPTQLELARQASIGRSAQTVFGGHEHVLRQTLIALASGHSLDEHHSPGEATVQALHGRVRLVANGDAWEGPSGDLLIVPTTRHALEPLEDSAVLLTVGKHQLMRRSSPS
jgi:quercetin dioxygenase-like cupin family protein